MTSKVKQSLPTQRVRVRSQVPRDGLLILGMHRSGTSALSGTLAKLGAMPPKTLMPPFQDNPKGYFESTSLVQLHDDLLASAGTSWSDWRQFNQDWYATSVAQEFKERARALLASEFGNSPLFVLKDPRVCRFSRFWLEIFAEEGITPRPILPIRLPLEVAQSLHTRDGWTINRGLLVWLRHVLDAEAASRDQPRSIIAWDALVKDWRPQADKIAQDLGIHWPRLSDVTAAEIDDFVTAELKRQRVTEEAARAHPEMHEWAMAAYDALIELSRNPGSNSARATLDDLRARFSEAARLFGRLFGGLEFELGSLRQALEAERQQRAQDAQSLAEARAQGVDAQVLEQERARAAELDRSRVEAEQALGRALERAQALEGALAAERATHAQDAGALERELARTAELDRLRRVEEEARARAEEISQGLEDALAAERAARAQELQLLGQERARGAELDRLRAEAEDAKTRAAETVHMLETALAAERMAHAQKLQSLEQERTRFAEVDKLRLKAEQEHAAAAEAVRQEVSAHRQAQTQIQQLTFRLLQEEEKRSAAEDERNEALSQIALQVEEETKLLSEAQTAVREQMLKAVSFSQAANKATEEKERLLGELHRTQEKSAELIHWIEELHHRYRSSTSWKLTGPLRRIRRMFASRPGRASSPQLAPTAAAPEIVQALEQCGLFDVQFYRTLAGLANDENPFVHYAQLGAARGLSPNPLFDPGFYLSRYAAVMDGAADAFVHYIQVGARRGFAPSRLFDPDFYLSANQDVRDKGVPPLVHYLQAGRLEGRMPFEADLTVLLPAAVRLHRLDLAGAEAQTFDAEIYAGLNQDIGVANKDAAELRQHYEQIGRRHGRIGTPAEFLDAVRLPSLAVPLDFDQRQYLAINPDVIGVFPTSFHGALRHYLQHGLVEGRRYLLS